MNPRVTFCFLACVTVAVCVGAAETLSIPAKERDPGKIYWGNAASFSNPAEIDYEQVLKETPEHKTLTKKKIEAGTAKYWLLLSKANNRAQHAICEVADDEGYDLVAAQGYLGGLSEPISAEDITQLVVDNVNSDDAE